MNREEFYKMISISLCMIVKNEAAVISRCLDTIQHLVDEINIIDTGSTDKTKEIVSRYTDRIFDFKWIDDFSAARNFAFSKATKQYILWLDADDVVLEKDQEKLLTLKKSLDPTIDSVTMDYHLAFDEYGKVTFKSKRNRLVKRDNHYRWIGAVHEYLAIAGNIYHSDVAITHRPTKDSSDRNLQIYEKRLAKGEIFTHRDLYYFANELTDHGQHERAIQFYEKFLATKEGWIEDNISVCGKLADCYLALDQSDLAL